MRLTLRLTLVFVLYATTILAGVAWWSYTSGRNSLRSATISELQSTAIEKHAALDEWVEEKRLDIGTLAASPRTIENVASLFAAPEGSTAARDAHDRFVREIQPRVDGGEFMVLMLLDPNNGHVIAATDPSEEGKFKENRLFFLNGKSAPYVQNVYYSVSLQGPAMTASAPVRSTNGPLLGVLAGRLNLDEMNDIINRRAGLWETDEAFLVNRSNLFVTQPRLNHNPAVLQQGVHTEAVRLCQMKTNGTVTALDYRGVPALVAYRWLPEYELCLIVKIDQDEALAPSFAFGHEIVVISGVALLSAMALGILISGGITRPILDLQAGVMRFGQGEQDIHVPGTGQDEIGDLAREFNKMATLLREKDARLHEYATELEQKVEERTAAIQRREKRYRSYIEVTGQIGWTTNAQGEVEEDLDSWRKYTSQSEEEVKGWGWSNALHPDDLDHAISAWQYAVANKTDYEVEYRIRRYDGVYRYFLARGMPVFTGDGNVLEWVGTCIDITERKQAEQEIASQSKFPTENPNPVLRVQMDGQILYANKASQELLEVWNSNLNGFLPEGLKEMPSTLLKSGVTSSVDIQCNDKIYSIIMVPILEVGYVNFYCSDVTERVRAEETLRLSENKFSILFNQASLPTALSRLPEYIVVDVNRAWAKVFGYSREETIGKTMLELGINRDSKQRNSIIHEINERKSVRNREQTFYSKSGEAITVLTNVNMIEIGGQNFAITSLQDITERKHAEDELKRLLDELKRSNTELEQFAYVASHDLQEPLRGVAGFAQLLQQRYQSQLDKRADEYISFIVEGTQRMQILINDLLEYSRIGRRGEDIQSTSAEAALMTTLENLNAAIREYSATITNESLPTVQADATQLVQLFQNLIGNAIKFKAEELPQIHIGVTDAGNYWQFSVRDNGIGIEPQYFDRIFQVFQRLHARSQYNGTGIGLAICKKIVERHGGRIWVESEARKGSTFYFTLLKGI